MPLLRGSMKEELINKYYRLMKMLVKSYAVKEELSNKKDKVLQVIRKVIDCNNDYLLTVSYLDWLLQYGDWLDSIKNFHDKDINVIIREFSYYYASIIDEYEDKGLEYDGYKSFVNRQDEVTKEATKYATEGITLVSDAVKRNYHYDHYYKLTAIILAYCHVYKKLNEFKDIYRYVIENNEQILDDFKLNGIKSEIWCTDEFIYRVIHFIENIGVREIK